ncbi:hypothetical protein K504DRAFT_383718 [Pleomassaria siparia CBS 279.74]|uniref:C2H2-type domain-containing protein n=1 Tax=Pleomassaria siparia CBS 279.74 TaxID=1314801 RepID=A0A6G1K4A6_9PLEO|nr:hypothetical protein K504DRAFT_383718 [Pleomassaria siparia CBS 279.74]
MKRTYQCRHCSRLFKRSEHCARHERVHTQERPFPCSFCERRYARKDLVKRHERSLHVEAYQAAHPDEFRTTSLSLSDQNYSLGVGEPSGQEKGDSTASSDSVRNATPLTPPIDTAIVDINRHANTCASENLFSVDHAFARGMQSPLGQFSPPASLHDQESRASILGTTIESAYQSNGHPAVVDFSPMELWADPPSSESLESMPLEPPAKRRRTVIEIDPMLLFGNDGQAAQSLASAVSPHEPFPLISSDSHASNRQDIDFYTASNTLVAEEGSTPPFYDFYTQSPLLHEPQTQAQAPKEINLEIPVFKFNEAARRNICEDARSRLPTGELVEALFPSADDLNHFFSAYMQSFHRHFPILHLSSLDVSETPSPLIFAICSIGAQYRLARQKAKNLFALAGTMSSYALRAGLPITMGIPKPGPLWIMQTRLLLSLCGMFSGKTNVVMRTVENLGLFAIDYRLRKSVLNLDAAKELDWEDWIGRESSKRLLCGMFIMSNLISTTFGISPGFNHTHDLEFEILDEERLWNARSAQEWMELRGGHAPVAPRSSVRDTMVRMIFEEEQQQQQQLPRNSRPEHISNFTMLLMMHAVNIYIWNLLQCSSTSSKIHPVIVEAAFSTLTRCEEIIAAVRATQNQGQDHHHHHHSLFTWTPAEGPLMFNCQGLLRIAYVRLFSNSSAFDRLTLLSDNPRDIEIAVIGYAESPQKRNQNLMKSVMKALEMLLATVKIGCMLLRETTALSWSIEHAIAAWDAALFLTKWVHAIEIEALLIPPSTEESHVLEELKGLLAEVGTEYKGSSASLAAQLAHFSSTTLSDCWVWGVAPRMGNMLRQLAFAYEKDYIDLISIESRRHAH